MRRNKGDCMGEREEMRGTGKRNEEGLGGKK